MASTSNNIGSLHRTRGNYVLAIENFQKSLKLKEEIGDMKGVANSYIGIGNILREQNEYAQALE
jgi:tetratricopeptide (TPR) repeat protein